VQPSEARALQWRDIEDDIVTYRRTFSANKLTEFTKTKKIRHNLLFPETLAILPERGFPLDFVFSHAYGGHKRPYQENMLNRIYRAAIGKVNAEKGLSLSSELYEHSKHSWGTQYINSGLDRGVIKDWFGHTDLKTTERYARFKVVDAVRKVLQLKEAKQ
jgi:integrase